MPDIKLRDGSGVENTYEGVDTITLPLADGSGTWTFGLTDEDLTLDEFDNRDLFVAKPNRAIWNKYIDRIDASNLKCADSLFYYYNGDDLDKIEITFTGKQGTGLNGQNMFTYCNNITKLPVINNFVFCWAMPPRFENCEHLESIQDIIDTPTYGCKTGYQYNSENYNGVDFSSIYITPMIHNCYRLKTVDFKNIDDCIHNANSTFYSYTANLYGFEISQCGELNNISNIPVLSADIGFTATSNFLGTHYGGARVMNRLSHITFAQDGNNQPYKANWKTQSMDLGYYSDSGPRWETTNFAGINEVLADYYNIGDYYGSTLESVQARYRAKKDAGEDDWVCYCGSTRVTYDGKSLYLSELFSRFNHDSAVELINSLPDTSEYLATAGGSNTIKFHGYSGALTDEGAINTMTPEEIQVATDKGWTVTFVD